MTYPYQLPPSAMVDLLDARPDPVAIWTSDSNYAILASRMALPDIAALKRRYLPLAGLRIDPIANSLFQAEFYHDLVLLDRRRGVQLPIGLPQADCVTKIGFVSWSHSNRGLVYSSVSDHGTELWYVSVEHPSAPILLTDRLHTVLQGIDWMPDGERILCATVPTDRGHEPPGEVKPLGPSVQEADGRKSPARTYQDLLCNAHDESLFVHYATSQLTILGPNQAPEPVGESGLNWFAAASPDGEHVLTVRLTTPFSYSLPVDFFPRTIEVIDLQGKTKAHVAEIPLSDALPIEGVRIGPRGVQWWPGEKGKLVWVEALDGGDPARTVEYREELKVWETPFEGKPIQRMRLKGRFSGLTFFSNPRQWMTSEYDRDRRWTTTLLHRETAFGIESKVFFDRSIRDRYGDPGRIVLESDAAGFSRAKEFEGNVLLAGVGAGPQGNRPFLDERNLDTLQSTRRWRCPENCSENVVLIANWDKDQLQILTRRESPQEPANFYLHHLSRGTLGIRGSMQLTSYTDPTPQLRSISKRIVRYERADGVPLSGTLYLPEGGEQGGPYPLLLWSYPLEFNDASTAGQVASNPNSFLRVTGANHLALLTQGYAILDDATMPVIGDPETMNDTFIEQIVSAAHAAIDHLDALKVIDPKRVAIGGHSYGAFMTANVLAHSDRFRAGIARSGAYNRTLTPFGFQSERRPLWQAKEVYSKVSPLMQADQIRTPMLLIHGEVDSNPGTFPMQSLRMFQAIKGNGGIARLVMLPYEGHAYRSRQSVMHVQYEMATWLDRYLKP